MIFEGAKTEPNILENIKKYFLNEKKEVVVKAIFGTTIYSLYQKFINFDEFDDDLEELDIDEPEQDEAVEETGNKKQRRPKTKKKKV